MNEPRIPELFSDGERLRVIRAQRDELAAALQLAVSIAVQSRAYPCSEHHRRNRDAMIETARAALAKVPA